MKTSMIQPIPGEQAGAHTGRVLDALRKARTAPTCSCWKASLRDFEKVLESGLVEELERPSRAFAPPLSQMYEPFQSFVTGEDGGMYGVPYGVYGLGMACDPRGVGEAAGPNAADAPQSYEGTAWTSPAGGPKGWRRGKWVTSA